MRVWAKWGIGVCLGLIVVAIVAPQVAAQDNPSNLNEEFAKGRFTLAPDETRHPLRSGVPRGYEPEVQLLNPKDFADNSSKGSGKSALVDGSVGGSATTGTKVNTWLADHGMGLVKGIGAGLVGAAAVVLVTVLVVGTGAPLLLMAGAAVLGGAVYGLITGSADFSWKEAIIGSIIGGASAGVGGWITGSGSPLLTRAAVATVDMVGGGLTSVASYLIHEPNPTSDGAAVAFGIGAGTAAIFMGAGAVVTKGWSWAKGALGFSRAGSSVPRSAMVHTALTEDIAPPTALPENKPLLPSAHSQTQTNPSSIEGTFSKVETGRGTAYVRGDIDWNLLRPIRKGGKEVWVTNAEAAYDGIAPVRRTADGKWERVELHHANQDFSGAFVELWETTHDKVPHKMVPDGESWRRVSHLSTKYRKQREGHWSWRSQGQLGGQE